MDILIGLVATLGAAVAVANAGHLRRDTRLPVLCPGRSGRHQDQDGARKEEAPLHHREADAA